MGAEHAQRPYRRFDAKQAGSAAPGATEQHATDPQKSRQLVEDSRRLSEECRPRGLRSMEPTLQGTPYTTLRERAYALHPGQSDKRRRLHVPRRR